MRVNDALIGAVLLALALAVLWHVRTFPPVPGQPYGSALFPTLGAAGLAVAAVLLIVQGLRSGAPWQSASAAPRSGRIAAAVTIAALLFYLLASQILGFIVSAVLMLVAMLWAYGVRRALILPVALTATLVIHTLFFKLLKVPLPWGWLAPVAW
jgi:putative tricarboxylic transport membrane protein